MERNNRSFTAHLFVLHTLIIRNVFPISKDDSSVHTTFFSIVSGSISVMSSKHQSSLFMSIGQKMASLWQREKKIPSMTRSADSAPRDFNGK
jgi:hypothetical protein